MRKQCVPGSFSSAHALEPGNEASTLLVFRRLDRVNGVGKVKGGVQKWVWYSEKAELHSQNATALSPSAFKNSVDCMASGYIRIVANFVLGGSQINAIDDRLNTS